MQALIIDDTPSMHKLLSSTLEGLGFETVSAYSGEEAVEIMAKHRPDLILLEIVLPRMDGRDLCYRIKKQPQFKDIPLIIITIRDEPQDRKICQFAGADFFLPKPFRPDDLLNALKAVNEKWAPAPSSD